MSDVPLLLVPRNVTKLFFTHLASIQTSLLNQGLGHGPKRGAEQGQLWHFRGSNKNSVFFVRLFFWGAGFWEWFFSTPKWENEGNNQEEEYKETCRKYWDKKLRTSTGQISEPSTGLSTSFEIATFALLGASYRPFPERPTQLAGKPMVVLQTGTSWGKLGKFSRFCNPKN